MKRSLLADEMLPIADEMWPNSEWDAAYYRMCCGLIIGSDAAY